ncbi:MAG: aminotransferase class V-fold PLP-dependent enzyme [Thermoflexales bacterium]|nr:aminotransferase class V-fold PLP-dependent enzyme [Thermoflexales bacterium]
MKLETLATHLGREVEAASGAVSPSIVLATTFERGADGAYPPGSHMYSRVSNPTRAAWERALAGLEGGAVAFALASGQAAAAAVFQSLDPTDHVLIGDDRYHGTRAVASDLFARWGLQVEYVDTTDLNAVRARFRPGRTRLLWLESPSNPLTRVSDITALAEIAHQHQALCAVDNTWASPVLQRPLALGADLVVHSTTKYFGGHSDVLGGAVVCAREDAFSERVRLAQRLVGGVQAPFDCWLLLRSTPTLPLRVRAQAANAQRVAEFLAGHPRVAATHYPGLTSHPGHALAARQMALPGSMLSIQVQGGQAEALDIVARCRLFTRATSLGGVESLIEHRASVEGPHTTTPANLLRLSIGIEHADDLIDDLRQALAA